jgi:hypothetical protein
MAKYYNKNPGPLAVTLKSGASACLPGKAWSEISIEEEGAEDLIQFVKKGYLTRFDETVADPQTPPALTPETPSMFDKPVQELELEPGFVMGGVDFEPAPKVSVTKSEEKSVPSKVRKTPDKQEG